MKNITLGTFIGKMNHLNCSRLLLCYHSYYFRVEGDNIKALRFLVYFLLVYDSKVETKCDKNTANIVQFICNFIRFVRIKIFIKKNQG